MQLIQTRYQKNREGTGLVHVFETWYIARWEDERKIQRRIAKRTHLRTLLRTLFLGGSIEMRGISWEGHYDDARMILFEKKYEDLMKWNEVEKMTLKVVEESLLTEESVRVDNQSSYFDVAQLNAIDSITSSWLNHLQLPCQIILSNHSINCQILPGKTPSHEPQNAKMRTGLLSASRLDIKAISIVNPILARRHREYHQQHGTLHCTDRVLSKSVPC